MHWCRPGQESALFEKPCIQAAAFDRNGLMVAFRLAVVAILIVSIVLAGVFAPAYAESPTVSRQAPDFALASSAGQNLRLSEFRGDVVVMNFWSVGCGRCRAQLDWLAAIDEAHFSVLSINVDGDSRAAARAIEREGYGFPVLFDTDKTVSRLYDPSRLPMTVMIDPHGTVRFIHEGYRRGDEKHYARELSELLAE
jgi:peroxiredoxin